MYKHKVVFTSDFYCDICKKGFPLKRNLDRHLKGDKHRTLAESLSAVVTTIGARILSAGRHA